jgi:hypothetical protein
MPEELLEKLLPHPLVGEAPGDGVPQEVRIHSLLDARLLGHRFYDLLDPPLRVVPALPGMEKLPGLPVADV